MEPEPISEEARFQTAIVNAEADFWDTFASHYPEAVAGDLAPDIVAKLRLMMRSAAQGWLQANAPQNLRFPREG